MTSAEPIVDSIYLAMIGTFVTVEVWTGQEAVDAHMKSPHFQAALGTFGEHLAGAPAIHPLKPVS